MSATPQQPIGSHAGDVDVQETREWLDALRAVIQTGGDERALARLGHRSILCGARRTTTRAG